MLIHALLLVFVWLVMSSLLLLVVGARLGGPSQLASFALISVIECAGGAVALAAGMPTGEVVACVVASSLCGLVVSRAFKAWNPAGHAAWLFLVEAGALYLAVEVVVAILVPVGLIGRLLGLLLLGMQCVSLLFLLSYTHELIDVVCRRRWRRPEGAPPRIAERATRARRDLPRGGIRGLGSPLADGPTSDGVPLVALHVPCHDEPPEVLEGTLRALARLDYPRGAYQVFVVDNNTSDSALWRPVAELCQELGFTFLHLEAWRGFKSGALNYALAMTPPEVELIGVVDADYLVTPDYLRDVVSYFADPAVAFVQTPQDYRDYGPESTFYQKACYHAYRYFFDVSMPSRNERDAIIFGGTMGIIRSDALRAIGGWDEWCITEDAEASLRLLMRGYEGRFVNRSYGRGLMPLEFDALKRQRFRWCFGGIQILRKHWAALLPWVRRAQPERRWEAPGLSAAQRYHYLLGGLQWYGDALTFGFTTLLLGTGWLRVVGHPLNLAILGGPLLLLPLAFWVTSLLRTLWGLRATRRCSWAEAVGAVGVMWSLSWVVTLASLQGLVRRRGVFLRTPKAQRAQVLHALGSTLVETLLAVTCLGLGVALFAASAPQLLARLATGGGIVSLIDLVRTTPWWVVGTSGIGLALLASLQGLTYLTAPALCLLSLRTEPKARAVHRFARGADDGQGIAERRLLLGALAVAATVALLVAGTSLLPQAGQQANTNHQGTLTTLLGAGAPGTTPTPHTNSTPPANRPTATATSGGPPTPTGTVTASPVATTTPHPGATPSPHGTPNPHDTPTPHPHP